jgi:hypothetical protein
LKQVSNGVKFENISLEGLQQLGLKQRTSAPSSGGYNAQKDLQKPKQRAFHQLGIEPNSARFWAAVGRNDGVQTRSGAVGGLPC